MTKSTGKNSKIVIIGAGRLATQLTIALYNAGEQITHIFSRTLDSAERLAIKVNAIPSNDFSSCPNINADIWIYAIKDDVIENIAPITPKSGFHFHTSGSVNIDVFSNLKANYGSIYPLQTFNIDRAVNFSEIPIFCEANNNLSLDVATSLSKKICNKVHLIDSEKRKHLHLAAVLACNFTNALWIQAEKLLENKDIPKDVIYPLISETLNKAIAIGASNAQTGPAARNDFNVINSHIQLLDNNHILKEIYQNISSLIINEQQL